MSFAELGLAEELVRAVRDLGYEVPTPIQRQAIPAVLAGGDLLAGAQTGTGKTAGFTLPILHRLATNTHHAPGSKPVIRALILTPTRELAAQVEESVRNYGKYLKLKSMIMFGGVGINPQIDQLRRGVDIVVATPGRLLDHLQQKTIDLSHVEILVLDEADRMLDMGFIRDIRRVLAVLPRVRQNLLFSATFSDEIKQLADDLLNSPAMIEVARRNTTAELVTQKVHPVDRDKKRELLTHLIKEHSWFQVLVFTRTKHGANRLAEQLSKDGISAMAIHGNKSQSARTRALAEFKDTSLQVLVATDIAARGIDIDQLEHVVNYDLPNVPEDYVHRIGRTGRAGATGEAVSLVCVDEHQLLADIERLIKRALPKEVVAGFEPDPTQKPEPILRRSGQRDGAPRGGNGGGGGQRRGAPAGNAGGRGVGSGSNSGSSGERSRAGSGSGSGRAPAGNSARAGASAPGAGRPQGQGQAQGQSRGQGADGHRGGNAGGQGNGRSAGAGAARPGQGNHRGPNSGNGQGRSADVDGNRAPRSGNDRNAGGRPSGGNGNGGNATGNGNGRSANASAGQGNRRAAILGGTTGNARPASSRTGEKSSVD
ncbi:DEAD/DEAH box helicase [Pararobbsia alpina]|uniref:ATP-dependent RNA helicase RhlE n=1 Tax=Pararobbsia alpina TaxID=621374 RepID=A0A6S7AWB0_9BURK|nr:DEAD/DEAH box helicase [Pararobbsia alpina]CAB3779852.1 ATP-dependent RNA helicase RhlE [Pararobbsia alpina]